MYRSSTPKQIFDLPFDYEQFVEKINITYKQKDDIIIEKTEADVQHEGNSVFFTFSQEETNKFVGDSVVKIQIKIKDKSGDVLISDIFEKLVYEVLNDKVL